ncbi:hypothetical protein [Cetobacterium sp. SF1]|uniref:hypothetical protein n=1 Tax=unclassified Cetobacterium TaxID=2630983 RepID=UPI003CEB6D3B
MESQKKLLLLLTGKLLNMDNLIESALFLKKNYNFKIIPLYIRNMDILIPPANLLVSALGDGIIGNNLEENDNNRIKEIYQKLKAANIIEPLLIETGLTQQIVEEYMKQSDLLMLNRNQTLSDDTFSILKESFKPILLISENPLSFNKIMIASDDGPKVHKSVLSFCNLFNNESSFEIIAYKSEKDNHILHNYLTEKNKSSHMELFMELPEFYKKINVSSLLIMGNLSKSYFLEKITNKKGLSIIENTKAPIFIGA